LKAITETTIRYIRQAVSTGVAGIYYAVQHNRYTHLSPTEFAEFGRPYDLQILEATGDLWLNLLHVHGLHTYLGAVADYPAQLVNWHDRDAGPSLAEGLAMIGGAACGGVSQWSLHRENPNKALEEIRDAIEQTDGRRLVLATGCVSMTTTPLRNIRALRAAVAS